MTRSTVTVTQEGILKGIPVYDPSISGLHAIVTGANGISGNAMVEWLAAHPQRWAKVHAISRREPYEPTPGNVVHHSLDLLNTSSEELAAEFKTRGISADYLFHFAYTDSSVTSEDAGNSLWSATDGLVANNVYMLKTAIEATAQQNRKLRRVVLQTGTKNYGFHLGPMLSPGTESDPKPEYQANFYYAQEEELRKQAEKHSFDWTVVRPSLIVGSPKQVNVMNVALAYALYIALNKEMGQEEIEFPGTYTNWISYCDQSYAPLNACFEEYTALTRECSNQDFNIHDGDVYTWSRGFPLVAECEEPVTVRVTVRSPETDYGVKVRKLTGKETNEAEFDTQTPSPRDGLPSKFVNRILVANWAKQPKVKAAWETLQKKHDLQPAVYEKMWWPLLDFVFGIQWDCKYVIQRSSVPSANCSNSMSMTKARDYGFFGYCDSTEAHYEMFKAAEANKLLPPGVLQPSKI